MGKETMEYIEEIIQDRMQRRYFKHTRQEVEDFDAIDHKYTQVMESLTDDQRAAITGYVDHMTRFLAKSEEYFYRLGLEDGVWLDRIVRRIKQYIIF